PSTRSTGPTSSTPGEAPGPPAGPLLQARTPPSTTVPARPTRPPSSTTSCETTREVCSTSGSPACWLDPSLALHALGHGLDLESREAAVAAEGDDAGEATLVGPAVHGLGRDVEDPGHLARPQVLGLALVVRQGHSPPSPTQRDASPICARQWSRGNPSRRSAITLRCTSLVPPAMVRQRLARNP